MEYDLKKEIAGEILLSVNPGRAIRKWRDLLNISQADLANELNVSRSVVSDYERGKRNPKIGTIKRFLVAMEHIDDLNGHILKKEFSLPSSIYDRREFREFLSAEEIVKAIGGEFLYSNSKKFVFGYTIVDSVKAILELNWINFFELYGKTTQRAILFTGVEYGRSPMIAVRVHPLKPGVVIYISPKKVDRLSVKLAMMEDIPLAVTSLDLNEVMKRLKELV